MLQSPQDFIYLFFIYAFLGWVLEVIYHVITDGDFVNRGFLIGPYCPIYGFGMIFILSILQPYLNKPFLLFVLSIALTSTLEFVGGYVLEAFFKKKWWDYSDVPFNIKGYICLKFSIFWGIGALISVKFIHPLIYRIYSYMPEPLVGVLIFIFSVMMLVDISMTMKEMLEIDKELKLLYEIDKKIESLSLTMGEKITEGVLVHQERHNKLSADFIKRHKRILQAFPHIQSRKYYKVLKSLMTKLKG